MHVRRIRSKDYFNVAQEDLKGDDAELEVSPAPTDISTQATENALRRIQQEKENDRKDGKVDDEEDEDDDEEDDDIQYDQELQDFMADTEDDQDKKEMEPPTTTKKKRKRKAATKKKKLKNKKDKKQKQTDKKQKQNKKQNNKKQKHPHRANSEQPVGLVRHGHRHSKALGIDRTAILQQLLTTSSKEHLIDPTGKRIPSTEEELEQAKKEIHRMKLTTITR